MSEPFLAEIRIFAGNFAPRGWAMCNGQLLAISQNTALFSLLGTTYGGDGRVTFALPNFQSGAAIGQGQGPGLTDRVLGETGGNEAVTLIISELPMHPHPTLQVQALANGNTAIPSPDVVISKVPAGVTPFISGTNPNTTMGPLSIMPTGGNLPHNNRQPYLGLTFLIAMQGIFPARN